MQAIPDDLAQALEEWHTAYRRLAVQPCSSLRRKLVRLSAQVLFHPYWQTGQRTPARSALYVAQRGARS
ncbi:hypothetical protein [Streptomyces brasiliensis]|uniref:Uncharacterized protein n=1 Tax=Streptomyces brasiliensis TaxID=1954 RepID=A0A917NE69_9ACTN|nr:hypothetical protein [Streptomyces brasiliensis]GGI94370.1 hypothetical protein GCM10010121_000950 [Streptomyces brasiliensis]